MSDIVNELRDAAVSDCVAYAEFMLQYKKGQDILYCFFEGYEDRTYYSVRIENISNIGNYLDFVCGGKGDVFKVHKLIRENPYYKDIYAGFFVDADFDGEVNADDIYVTPTYSIENLYCCQEAFEKILLGEFHMARNDGDFKKCVANYLKLQTEFTSKTLLFNAWLACQADYRHEHKTSTRMGIDKKVKAIFEKIVLPDLSSIKDFTEIQSKEQFEALYPDSPVISAEQLKLKFDEFKKIDHPAKLRGKFLLRLLENYLVRLQSIFGMECSPFEGKYSCKLRFEFNTLCSNLSQYAKTPTCLRDYIRKYCSKPA